MTVAIIDYNAGNVRSVLYALERLGQEAVLTADPAAIRQADKVIFPGVGEASTTMAFLRERKLDTLICSLTQPVLGVCLGMQLLCEHSEENDTPCLGIIPQEVKRFQPRQHEKVPHMGWNTLRQRPGSWLSASTEGQHVYFVHSYYVEVGPYTAAETDYIHPFSAVLRKDNFYATQFHPEKSGSVGEQILRDFLAV
ncbi:MAG: imidazole glycerol phosphate synthase subunit HisH [Bacteroidetes bacterium]|nr:MAG: imidazole glycerol phosphate synthase subunit HisH [Bacteroidota bacterium]PTM12929.1 MAG: imidazole glycerol phosphate synthase subunit HisH [Bacteroidota bacterium]